MFVTKTKVYMILFMDGRLFLATNNFILVKLQMAMFIFTNMFVLCLNVCSPQAYRDISTKDEHVTFTVSVWTNCEHVHLKMNMVCSQWASGRKGEHDHLKMNMPFATRTTPKMNLFIPRDENSPPFMSKDELPLLCSWLKVNTISAYYERILTHYVRVLSRQTVAKDAIVDARFPSQTTNLHTHVVEKSMLG